jgi:hypothetical protein
MTLETFRVRHIAIPERTPNAALAAFAARLHPAADSY